MSLNLNKCFLAGNLTRDIELSYTPSQTSIAKFGIGINRTWTGNDGVKKQETCFVDCTAFGKTADTINKYFSKGKPILIEGRLKLEQWESEGGKKSRHVIIVESFHFVDSQAKTSSQAEPEQESKWT